VTAASAASEPAGPIVFHDPFESLVTANGIRYTQPTVFGKVTGQPAGAFADGCIGGREGRACAAVVRRHDDNLSGVEPLNLLGGELSFWSSSISTPTRRMKRPGASCEPDVPHAHCAGPERYLHLLVPERREVLIRNSQGIPSWGRESRWPGNEAFGIS